NIFGFPTRWLANFVRQGAIFSNLALYEDRQGGFALVLLQAIRSYWRTLLSEHGVRDFHTMRFRGASRAR
ncbi:hypothetical protein N9567_05810, partial [Planktomarina temperata]|nr:hypothetical protein [Planktomarina temperata]